MIDAHVHLEKGAYNRQWLDEFINEAVKRNKNEVCFLEHNHIFKECRSLYSEMSKYNEYQSKWFAGKDSKSRDIKRVCRFYRSDVKNVIILAASDAHYNCDVGRNIEIMQSILDRY